MGGTIIKVWKSGSGTAYWQVPIREGAVTKSGAEYKIAINESGNDSAGAMKKLSELLGGEWKVMGVVRAVLCSAQGVPGERAALSVTGIAATLTPKAGAQLTHLTLSVGDAESNLGVEAALTAANLEWEPWEGCTPQEALVPVGNSMPTVADARAKAATLANIAGSDNFKAQAAAKAMGIASATIPSDVGSVAAIAAHWAGFGEATDAVVRLRIGAFGGHVRTCSVVVRGGGAHALAPWAAVCACVRTGALGCRVCAWRGRGAHRS